MLNFLDRIATSLLILCLIVNPGFAAVMSQRSPNISLQLTDAASKLSVQALSPDGQFFPHTENHVWTIFHSIIAGLRQGNANGWGHALISRIDGLTAPLILRLQGHSHWTTTDWNEFVADSSKKAYFHPPKVRVLGERSFNWQHAKVAIIEKPEDPAWTTIPGLPKDEVFLNRNEIWNFVKNWRFVALSPDKTKLAVIVKAQVSGPSSVADEDYTYTTVVVEFDRNYNPFSNSGTLREPRIVGKPYALYASAGSYESGTELEGIRYSPDGCSLQFFARRFSQGFASAKHSGTVLVAYYRDGSQLREKPDIVDVPYPTNYSEMGMPRLSPDMDRIVVGVQGEETIGSRYSSFSHRTNGIIEMDYDPQSLEFGEIHAVLTENDSRPGIGDGELGELYESPSYGDDGGSIIFHHRYELHQPIRGTRYPYVDEHYAWQRIAVKPDRSAGQSIRERIDNVRNSVNRAQASATISYFSPGLTLLRGDRQFTADAIYNFPAAVVLKVANGLLSIFSHDAVPDRLDISVVDGGLTTEWTTQKHRTAAAEQKALQTTAIVPKERPAPQPLSRINDEVAALNRLSKRPVVILDPQTVQQLDRGAKDLSLFFTNGKVIIALHRLAHELSHLIAPFGYDELTTLAFSIAFITALAEQAKEGQWETGSSLHMGSAISRNGIMAVLWELQNDPAASVSESAKLLIERLNADPSKVREGDTTIGELTEFIVEILRPLDQPIGIVEQLADELGVGVTELQNALNEKSSASSLIARLSKRPRLENLARTAVMTAA